MNFNELPVATESSIYEAQRTPEGRNYERFARAAREHFRENAEARKRACEAILSMRHAGVGPASVHSNTILSNMSRQYKNDEYIGTELMAVVPVSKLSDSFAVYPMRERIGYPDDALGARSRAAQITSSRETDNYSCKAYGYEDFVSKETVENQDAAFDEMMDLTEGVAEGVAFRREKRIATVLTTVGNFGNSRTLTGSDRWDSSGGGNPVKDIQDMRALCWQGRGPGGFKGYCDIDTWNVLARHPMIRGLFQYQTAGLASPDQLARYFGLDTILVGAAREDTANSGASAVEARIWGKCFGIVRVARRPTLRNAVFGFTAQFNGDPVTTEWYDPAAGAEGGYFAKVATREDHKVQSPDTGALIVSPIS